MRFLTEGYFQCLVALIWIFPAIPGIRERAINSLLGVRNKTMYGTSHVRLENGLDGWATAQEVGPGYKMSHYIKKAVFYLQFLDFLQLCF